MSEKEMSPANTLLLLQAQASLEALSKLLDSREVHQARDMSARAARTGQAPTSPAAQRSQRRQGHKVRIAI